MTPYSALILVDLQNDFCSGGALAVPNGEQAVPFANKLRDKFFTEDDIVIATQDWHPANHKSFAANHKDKHVYDSIDLNGLQQTLWPVHCVAGTRGAEFHPDLELHGVTIFRKGTNPEIDSYSGFYDNGRKQSTGLTHYLKNLNVHEVHVMGLATDYCVKFTALDSIKDGFLTYFYEHGSFGVNINPDDVAKAIKEMEDAGVILMDIL